MKPPFEDKSIEELSLYIYGHSFTGQGMGEEEREAFRQSLVVSATEEWTARMNGLNPTPYRRRDVEAEAAEGQAGEAGRAQPSTRRGDVG
jgi:hypothetical protein